MIHLSPTHHQTIVVIIEWSENSKFEFEINPTIETHKNIKEKMLDDDAALTTAEMELKADAVSDTS